MKLWCVHNCLVLVGVGLKNPCGSFNLETGAQQIPTLHPSMHTIVFWASGGACFSWHSMESFSPIIFFFSSFEDTLFSSIVIFCLVPSRNTIILLFNKGTVCKGPLHLKYFLKQQLTRYRNQRISKCSNFLSVNQTCMNFPLAPSYFFDIQWTSVGILIFPCPCERCLP